MSSRVTRLLTLYERAFVHDSHISKKPGNISSNALTGYFFVVMSSFQQMSTNNSQICDTFL